MSRPTWPPRYVNVSIALLRNDNVTNAAYRFYCKLQALAWGEPQLHIEEEALYRETGLRQSQVYEYARLLRAHAGLLFRRAGSAFEFSFPELAPDPLAPDFVPAKAESQTQIPEKAECENGNSGKPGIDRTQNTREKRPIPENPELLTPSLSRAKSKNTGGGGDSGKPGKPKKVPTPAAVAAFRGIANRFPDKAVWPQITAAVGEKPDDLDRWKRTVEGWIAAGHYKLNVGGMLDWYRQGRTSKGAPASVTKNSPPANGRGPMLPEGLLDG